MSICWHSGGVPQTREDDPDTDSSNTGLLFGRGRLHLRGLLFRLRGRCLPRTRALLLPLRDLRLGGDEPAPREGEPGLAADAVLLQPLFAFVHLERFLGVDDKAKYSS